MTAEKYRDYINEMLARIGDEKKTKTHLLDGA